MRILYVARHGQMNSNDDEGAIVHALQLLGHHVNCFGERNSTRLYHQRADLLLFHKWHDPTVLVHLKMPAVFWYFDLVEWPGDPLLESRCAGRVRWMQDILPLVKLGFCTDGDWVMGAQVRSDVIGKNADKLVWLPQGYDTRQQAFPYEEDMGPDILFTGISTGGGTKRLSFVEEMNTTYGPRFQHVPKGFHGKRLSRLIASAKVVVAPDSPVTDRYWSNRVYNTLGLGAFMLHPCSEGLAKHYRDAEEIVFYNGRNDLHAQINFGLNFPAERKRLAIAGRERTLAEHTYSHRVAQMLATVKERLGLC